MIEKTFYVKAHSSSRELGIAYLGEEVTPLNGCFRFYIEGAEQKGVYECHGRNDDTVTCDEMKEIQWLDDSHINFRVDVDGNHENWYNMTIEGDAISGTCTPYPYHFLFPLHFDGKEGR